MPMTNTSALSSPPLLHPQTLRLSYLPPVDGLLQQHHHVLTLTAGRLEAFRPLQEDALKITHGREVDIREGLLAHSLVVNLTGYSEPVSPTSRADSAPGIGLSTTHVLHHLILTATV